MTTEAESPSRLMRRHTRFTSNDPRRTTAQEQWHTGRWRGKRTTGSFIGLLLVSVLVSPAFGGIVLFAPETIVVDRTQQEPGPMDVAVALIGGGGSASWDAFEILFGSDDVVITDFVSPHPNQPFIQEFGYYANELFVSVYLSVSTSQPVVATLSFDLGGLVDGEYSVLVDSVRDDGISALISQGTADPLNGSLPIRIVPEPTTCLLLLAGLLTIGSKLFREVRR